MSRKPHRNVIDKRIMAVVCSLSVLLALLVFRLGWIQGTFASGSAGRALSWKQKAVMQREQTLVLDDGRGDFVDRYGQPLTGATYQALAVFPVDRKVRGEYKELERLAQALNADTARFMQWLSELYEPKFWKGDQQSVPLALTSGQIEAIQALRIEGVRILPYRNRYNEHAIAAHAIGYISQHPEWLQKHKAEELDEGRLKLTARIGGSGLERALDPLLRGAGGTSVMFFRDGKNAPLHGLDLRYTGPGNPYYPLQVQTTIDAGLQNELEQLADAEGIREGAIVVLDARNGDILAMVSRPQLKPNELSAPHTDLANHAVRAVEPGSIFKLVTEAAALEAGVTNEQEQFECSGDYGKYGLHCWKEGGHGRLNLQDALAQSCNIAFAEIAERLQPADLYQTADKLGIGRQIGWYSGKVFPPLDTALRLIPEEQAGKVFAELPAVTDGGQLAQTGIGQRDVRMTPLQAANLTVTLLHQGQVIMPRMVTEIRYANGQRLAKLEPRTAPSAYGSIRPSTAKTLLRGMEAVVNYGTGRSLASHSWHLAGKSGTAETLKEGKARNHHWFTGFGPVETPRYAAAVLLENQPAGVTNKAGALFGRVMEIVQKREQSK